MPSCHRQAFLASLLAVVVACCGSCSRRPSRPHIFLISADALRADHLSGYGYSRPTSPSLDRFAAAAWRFTDALTEPTPDANTLDRLRALGYTN